MPTTVTIPGIDKPVEFPDEMSQEQIQAASAKLYAEHSKPEGNPLSRGMSAAWQEVNPITGIKGAAQLLAHPLDTYNQDSAAREAIWEDAKKRFQSGDYAGGLAKSIYGAIPFVGPGMSQAGDYFEQGKTAEGVGKSIGMGLNLAGPSALKGVMSGPAEAAQGLGSRMYQSALKPSIATAPEKVGQMVATAAEEGIPVSAKGLTKVQGLIDDLNTKIKDTIATDPNRPISPMPAIENAEATKGKFAKQVNPNADLAAIEGSKNEFIQNLPPEGQGPPPRSLGAQEAQEMKQGTYKQVKYGQLSNATSEAQKALARGLKDELADQFPEIKQLNARESGLLGLEPVLERAVQRITNQQFNWRQHLGTAMLGSSVGYVTHSPGAVAAVTVMKMVVDNPVVRSKIALALMKADPALDAAAAAARVQGYINSLSEENQVKHDGKLVVTPDGEMVRKNRHASMTAERGAANRFSPNPVEAAKLSAGGAAKVKVNPKLPVSRTVGTDVELAPDAGPAEGAHEGEHVRANLKGTRGPSEGSNAKEKYGKYA